MSESEHYIALHKRLLTFSHSEGFVRLSRRDKLDELAVLCCELLDVRRASVWQLSHDQLRLDLETLYDQQSGPSHERLHLLQKDHPEYFNAMLSERIIDAVDAYNDPRTSSFGEAYLPAVNVNSMLDAPVFDHGEIFGVICLESSAKREWSVAEMAFACAVADTISLINTYEAWQQSQQELDYVTHFDDLTGLSNQRSLQKRLSHLVRHSASQDKVEPFALAWINIDKLKQINEGLGQEVGNEAIVLTANKLRQLLVRGKDKIARIGGNEFAVIIRNTHRRESLERTVEEFIDQMLKPLTLPSVNVPVTLSAGVCVYPEDGRDGSTLMRHAEAAMYQAKESGHNCAQFFNARISQQARAKFTLERELRRALETQGLDVFYQPIFATNDYRLMGVEALVRWRHHSKGLLTPDEFLPLAKSAGLIYQLDSAVIQCVCRDLKAMQRDGFHMPKVSINLSAEQVRHPDLASHIAQWLDQYKIRGEQLEFEVIEDIVQHDSQQLLRSLQALVSLGPTLAIDDFGTGYSSLSRLKHLPFHKLKIDRSFVRELPHNIQDCAIVKSIVALAKGLGMQVVVEGVETAEQRDWLSRHNVDFLQGYLLGRPMPLHELRDSQLAKAASA